jgi:hypothetical protein
VEKQQELPLDSFAKKEFGIVTIGELRTIVNFKEAPFPIGEESHDDGDIHIEFSCVVCLAFKKSMPPPTTFENINTLIIHFVKRKSISTIKSTDKNMNPIFSTQCTS